MTTLRITTKLAGVLVDVTSVTLADKPADQSPTYGIRRTDTGVVVVAAGTVVPRVSTGVYEYEFADTPGVPYEYRMAVLYRGGTSIGGGTWTANLTPATVEEAIYAAIKADSAIAALIEGDRVYPAGDPGLQSPAVAHKSMITVQVISGSDEVSTDGVAGIHEDRVQLTCWSETHDACLALFAAVRALFGRLSGTYAGVTILETYIENRGDVPGLGLADEQFDGYGKFLDVMISY